MPGTLPDARDTTANKRRQKYMLSWNRYSRSGFYRLQPKGQIWPGICFCTNCKPRMVLAFLNGWKLKKKNLWHGKAVFSVSISKVLLAHSHAHLFLYYLWLLWGCSHHNRDHRACKAEHGYSQVLHGKSLSAPLLESCCSQCDFWTTASAPPGCLLEIQSSWTGICILTTFPGDACPC